ncbi:MAG TPA: CocE/NonD family hydrolase, partial [Actinomycetota bacterium]|nr:CocE/NonD family hydrolase [Actinomycetota bacterium]
GLEFFDAFLRGKGDPAHLPQVRWRLGHADERTGPTWPPAGAREVRLYLDRLGSAGDGPEGGALAAVASREGSSARWVHDPANLVPSTVRDPFSFLAEYPDEREVQSRGDVATFTSEPSEAPLDLAGPVAAELSVSTTGPSMHVYVKLCDVDPDGAAHMLVRGQALARDPDPPRPVRIDLGHTGYRLLPGHRLRLQIASSDFPLYLWHPGTSENPWTATRWETNEQTVHAGGSSPSHVSLSVLD